MDSKGWSRILLQEYSTQTVWISHRCTCICGKCDIKNEGNSNWELTNIGNWGKYSMASD